MNRGNLIWLILGAYGVWFAILSGIEEMSIGKYWKAVLALIFGIISYWIIEKKVKK
jgi:hypothetical protein